MSKIKICGLTNRQSVEFVHDLGVDYLGFVFAASKRQITAEIAAELVSGLPGTDLAQPKRIGVFVNDSLANMQRIADIANLHGFQLHGDESPEQCHKLRKQTGKLVWKAWRVKNNGEDQQIQDYQGTVDAILLDTYSAGQQGGTGQTFPWECINQIKQLLPDVPLIAAGGLSADNVNDLVTSYSPFAVDVSSGVETNGEKDFEKIRQFVRKVREQT
jgi:phosphoribosylanthranilate isomerase